MSSAPATPYDENINRWLEAHLLTIQEKIRSQAQSMADSDGRKTIEPRDIAEAAKLYAPGELVPTTLSPEPLTFRQRVLSSISGITLISAILAVVFGIIGYFSRGEAQITAGAWDIAKIFAGAVVGSTGATVNAQLKRD